MSPNSNELSMLIVRNYVLQARDLVIADMREEDERQQRGGAAAARSPSALRTPDNWWGDNEDMPLAYVVSSAPVAALSSDDVQIPEIGQRLSSADRTLRIADILTQIPVCAHLAERQLRQLTAMGATQSVEAGRVLFHEGDPADKVYLILAGKVTIYKQDGDGSEIELARFGTGEFFGEMALFERGVRSAAVRALEPCKFFVFNGEQFLAMVLG